MLKKWLSEEQTTSMVGAVFDSAEEASPLFSVAVITGFAAVAGLLAGGMFSLRPDHDPLIERARRSTGEGCWFLLVHTRRPEQRERARSVLSDYSDDTIQTI